MLYDEDTLGQVTQVDVPSLFLLSFREHPSHKSTEVFKKSRLRWLFLQ